MPTHFHIVIPTYNTVKWLKKTLQSVASQRYPHVSVCVIDDASTDLNQKPLIESFAQKYGFKTIYRDQNVGAVANFIAGIEKLSPKDDDVIVMLDGDDWLFGKKALCKLAKIYEEEPVELTYGQYITYPRWQLGLCRPQTAEERSQRDYRKRPWVFSHPRTFRYKLWKLLNFDDLKEASGEYYKTACDLAMMYPLLEMAGDAVKYVEDILYVYNLDNPLNDHVAHLERQQRAALEIRKKPPYPKVALSYCQTQNSSFQKLLKNYWTTIYQKLIEPKCYVLAFKKLLKKVHLQ